MAPQGRSPKTAESPSGGNGVSVPHEALSYRFPEDVVEERIANEAIATQKITEFWFHGIAVDTEAFGRYADMPQLTNYAGVFTALVEFVDVLVARGVKRISTCASESYYDEISKTYYIGGAQFSVAGVREALRNEGNKLLESAHTKTRELLADRTIASGMAVPAGAQAKRKPGKRPSTAEQEQKLRGNRLYVANAVLAHRFPESDFTLAKLTDDYTQFKVMDGKGEYAQYIIVVSPRPPFKAALIKKGIHDGKWVTAGKEEFYYTGKREKVPAIATRTGASTRGYLAELLETPG